ncbi:YdcF family protein [Paraburkholderia acidicola]|uniref:YdcF family protein n=1 Tax=Paraburkholderia acidicola TaxID=1912599 RepID=UPI0012FFB46E|nr:ElyC/SanA/YdcF family protein [Paraburkholderia acidicola]
MPPLKRARQLSPEADRSALRRYGAPVTDLSTFNPAKLVGVRCTSHASDGVSLDFRTRQIQLALEIEKLKARESNDKATVDEKTSAAAESVAGLVALSETAASYRTHDAADATHAGDTADPVHGLARHCEEAVVKAVTPATLESLSAAVEIQQSTGQLTLQRFSVKQSLDISKIKDSPSTVFVLNGNNDEGYVKTLGAQLAHLKQVRFIVSGFGGHGTTDRYPVRTDRTEADRFVQLLREAGIDRGQIVVEPFSTNSGENARYVGQLLSRKPSDEPIDIVVCGTPAAVLRQTLTYVAQMPHDGKRTINFKAAPRVPLGAYETATDSLATLRECFTLLNYLHNTDYLPGAAQFANAGEYSNMMSAIGAEPVEAIRRFRKEILETPADETGSASALFTDGDRSFSLQDAMRDIAFVDKPGFEKSAATARSLSLEQTQALQRAHRAVSKMFEAVETQFERTPNGTATPNPASN